MMEGVGEETTSQGLDHSIPLVDLPSYAKKTPCPSLGSGRHPKRSLGHPQRPHPLHWGTTGLSLGIAHCLHVCDTGR